jgi:hypothetical protein
MQPGETVSPQSTSQPAAPASAPAPSEPQAPQEQESFYKSDASSVSAGQGPSQPPVSVPALSWEASEYIDHEKSGGWYILLTVGAVVVAVGVYFLTKGDWFATGVVSIAAILFGIVAARRPRTLKYEITGQGIGIGDKHYAFSEFKTFSLITDSALHSIQLLPLKRFMPPLSMYFPPTEEENVVQTLGNYLPYENRGHDAFDRLMGRIRF